MVISIVMLVYQRVRVAETSCNMVRCLCASWDCVRASGAQDQAQAARLIWLLRVSQPHDTLILICYYLLTKHFFLAMDPCVTCRVT